MLARAPRALSCWGERRRKDIADEADTCETPGACEELLPGRGWSFDTLQQAPDLRPPRIVEVAELEVRVVLLASLIHDLALPVDGCERNGCEGVTGRATG